MIADQQIAQEEKEVVDRFDLRSKLRFNQETGKIWLGESRLLLFHAKALMEMRTKLFDYLDAESAKRMLIRIGFVAGEQDADLAHKLADNKNNYDVFRIGPELHAFEGHVRSHITEAEIDWETGRFFGEVIVENSWEAEAHLQSLGLSEEAACWTMVGYASGYTSRFFRRFIVFKEIECMCKGDHHCKIVGKPADCWDDENYIELFRDDPLSPSLREIEKELSQLRGKRQVKYDTDGLLGASPEFTGALNLLKRAADSPINVLLLGETGVGKEVFARTIHEHSPRKDQPFVAINCASIPENLLESELFGYEKGAFTGANKTTVGKIETAQGGTLFLDEIGDMPIGLQAKMLRFLQERVIERVGGRNEIPVDIRVICATHRDIQTMVGEETFREDLFYRIGEIPINIPPLREREQDIVLLARTFLNQYREEFNAKAKSFSDGAIRAMLAHRWPGNIRELQNKLKSAVIMAEGTVIQADDLGLLEPSEDFESEILNLREVREQAESKAIRKAYQRADKNMSKTAELLGVTRPTLYSLIDKYHLEDLKTGV